MPVRYGIVCDHCRKFYFVSGDRTASHIHYDRKRGEFKVVCVPPCKNTIHFQRGMIVPYIIPDAAIQRGYAHIDDCSPVTANE
jgi:hypothetical protein